MSPRALARQNRTPVVTRHGSTPTARHRWTRLLLAAGVVAAMAVPVVGTSGAGAVDAPGAASGTPPFDAANSTVLATESFAQPTTSPSATTSWAAVTGQNAFQACLTAGTSTTQTPLAGCGGSTDPAGQGALRLTPSTQHLVGTVYNTISVPTVQGLQINFDSYQWHSGGGLGADGLSFILAATDPANPHAPERVGPAGGALGYSAAKPRNLPSSPGVSYGYLGFGLSVFNTWSGDQIGGSNCPEPSQPGATQTVAVRGPGDGTLGYCLLQTNRPASTYLGLSGTNVRPQALPVEIAINPSNNPTPTDDGLSVPSKSWLMAYTPYRTDGTPGTRQVLTGALPTYAAAGVTTVPAGWLDGGGIPHQLTFGWAASTGDSADNHQVANFSARTLTGKLPAYGITVIDDQDGQVFAGGSATVTIAPTLQASEGDEPSAPTVTATFPTGVTPTAPSTSAYNCAVAGQVLTCPSTGTATIPAGTPLPTIAVPVSIAPTATSPATVTATVSSADANPATASDALTVNTFGATATPATTTYGSTVTLAGQLPAAVTTGAVAFASGSTPLCSYAVGSAVSCTAPATLAAAAYPVTATYTDAASTVRATATASFTVTKATPALQVSPAAASVSYGSTDTLTFTGMPAAATGTITVTDDSSTTLCTLTLGPVLRGQSCATSATAPTGAHTVTAAYSGDGNFTAATATANYTVTKAAAPDFTISGPGTSSPFGTPPTLSFSGLAAGSTGTVTFSDGSGHTYCSVTLPASDCEVTAVGGNDFVDVGSYPVTASYSGDGNHLVATSNSISFTVVAATATVPLSVSANPIQRSDTEQFTLSVPPHADGSATVTVGSTGITCTIPDLTQSHSCSAVVETTPTDYQVSVSYAGGTRYQATTAPVTLTVQETLSPTFAGAGPTGVVHGQTIDVFFSGLAAGATGTVNFEHGGSTVCQATITGTSGGCELAQADFPAGTYAMTADYPGDGNVAHVTADFTLTIGKAPTALRAGVSDASVSSIGTESLIAGHLPADATGSVTFTHNSTTLCTIADVSVADSCTVANQAAGHYDVTAAYAGDDNYLADTDTTAYDVTLTTLPLDLVAHPASVPHGTDSTLVLTGTFGGPTGTVTITTGSARVCSTFLIQVALSCATDATTTPGSYPLTASYEGDSRFSPVTANAEWTVTKAAPEIIALAGSPTITFGRTVFLGISGLPRDATGSATFTAGTTVLCTDQDVTAPPAGCSTAATLPAGTYAVTATYSGDDNYTTATAQTSFTVTKVATKMQVAAADPSIVYGTGDTLSATGLPAGATGSISFTSGNTALCIIADVTVPTPSCDVPAGIPGGRYLAHAAYSGDGNHQGTTAEVEFVVNPAPVALAAAATPSQVGFPAAATLAVSGIPSGATGTVTFSDATSVLCTATLPAVSCAAPAVLPLGDYPVTAAYSGDGNYRTATATTGFTVVRGTPQLNLTISTGQLAFAGSATFTAAGLPDGATGTVVFTAAAGTAAAGTGAARPLCTATLPATDCRGGNTLPVGDWTVTATYSGDDDYDPVTATAPLSVVPAGVQLVASAPATVPFDDQATLAVTGLPAAATGSVTFSDTTSVLCTATLPATSCQAPARLPVGHYPVTARYSGDPSFDPASAATAFDVVPVVARLVATAPATVPFDAQATLAVTGLPEFATGTVTFSDSTSVLCTATLPATSCQAPALLPPGSYPVTATYPGDENVAAATATTSFQVVKGTVTITATADPTSIRVDAQTTLSVSGLPSGATGTVTFAALGAVLCTATLPETSCATPAYLTTGTVDVTAEYSGDDFWNPASASTSFTITGRSLPDTGVDVADPLRWAGVLLIGGLGLLVAGRARRRRSGA
jgi:hypothetical protein